VERLERLRRVIAAAKAHPIYEKKLRNVDPETFQESDLQEIEPTPREEWLAYLEDHPEVPDGAALVHLTPSPRLGWMPEFMSLADVELQWQGLAPYFQTLGLGRSALVTFSYHVFAGGWLFHQALMGAGVAVFPHGPGEAARVAELVSRFQIDTLVTNPSFALRLAEAGVRVKKMIAAGEPFTSVPGFRERVEAALGAKAFDVFGSSELGLVAGENSDQDGLYEFPLMAVLEVLDPTTAKPVPAGERGELVVTSLTRTLMPMIRFQTGDLALFGGLRAGRVYLPRGVIGRVDQMVKVKGVKLYPSELAPLLRAYGVERYRVVIEKKPSGTDALILEIQGDAVPEGLEGALRERTGLRVDRIEVLPEVQGGLLEDRRSAEDGATPA